jgi:hypothetical protein
MKGLSFREHFLDPGPLPKLSSSYSNILLFNTLTGLRPEEACKAIQIIHREENTYVKRDTMILEGYRFPDIFIRRTLRLAVKRKKLDMNMA